MSMCQGEVMGKYFHQCKASAEGVKAAGARQGRVDSEQLLCVSIRVT